jgi:hypothetical protein
MPRGRHQHTRKTVRKLIDAWGLSEPKRAQLDAARAQLLPNEYWLLDLGRKLDINRATLARWCRRGWVHARRLQGPFSWWVVWADAEERDRLRRLYAYGRGCAGPQGSRYLQAKLRMRTTFATSSPPCSTTNSAQNVHRAAAG